MDITYKTLDGETRLIPDVTQGNKDMPAGKCLLCECGELEKDAPRALWDVIDTSRLTIDKSVQTSLVARLPGWSIAGSVMRWDNGAYGAITHHLNGTRSGQWFKKFEQAKERFLAIREKGFGQGM